VFIVQQQNPEKEKKYETEKLEKHQPFALWH
jgi:hypothetical protein